MTILVTPGNVESLSPDTIAMHPFDALHSTLLNYTTTLVESQNLSDRAVIRIPFTRPGEAPKFVAEGGDIDETSTSVEELTISTRKIATIKTIANEALAVNNSTVDTAEMVIGQAKEDVNLQADQSLLMPVSYPGGLKGILAHLAPEEPEEGKTARDYLTDGGNLGTTLDPFVDAIANIIAQGGREEDITILASPTAWANLAKMKDSTNGNRPLIDAMSPNFDFAIPNSSMGAAAFNLPPTVKVRHLMGLPLLVTPIIGDPSTGGGDIIISDRRNIVSAASALQLTASKDHAFKKDSTSYRLTYRLGWKIFNPSRITYLSSTGAGV